MNAKDYKSQLKLKTPEAVDTVCKEMEESPLSSEDWRKVFSMTLMKQLLNTENIMIAIRLSSAFWKQDPKLWEEFISVFLSIRKLHKNEYFNELIACHDYGAAGGEGR